MVGGAAACIDLGAPGGQRTGDNGLVGAGLETAVAGTTAVGQWTVVGIGGEGDHQFADVAVRAEEGIDEERVFAPPTETGLDCPIFIADRGCVDKGAPLEAGIAGIEGGEKLIEEAFEALVVVFAIGVLGNLDWALHKGRGLVAEEDGNDGACSGEEKRGVVAKGDMFFHVVHVGLTAIGKPFGQPPLAAGNGSCDGEATGIEAEGEGGLLNPLGFEKHGQARTEGLFVGFGS